MTNWRVVTKSIEYTTHFLMTLKGGMKYCSEALQLELLKLLTSRTYCMKFRVTSLDVIYQMLLWYSTGMCLYNKGEYGICILIHLKQ
uniref:Uncharacterized protein n=1 Tax=Anguilla anguilla TaxID=7936 RepID=A0A0E9PXJ7_ANGAN